MLLINVFFIYLFIYLVTGGNFGRKHVPAHGAVTFKWALLQIDVIGGKLAAFCKAILIEGFLLLLEPFHHL